MPIEVGIWNVTNGQPSRINYSAIDSEMKLEDILVKGLDILSEDLMLLGRQIQTSYGKFIDMLGIDVEGKLTIVELKKHRTPRDVVAQAIDYASWVQNLSYDEVKEIFEKQNAGVKFESAFSEKFDIQPPEKVNQEHDMIVVCAELDPETERIINYLSDNHSVPINAVFFRYFQTAGQEFLSRNWLIDPSEAVERSSQSRIASKSEPWNGRDFVVNIDVENGLSTWIDSIKYGFVSAGGGRWYINSLNSLFPGARVFAMIPGKGYIGVGTVVETVVPVKDFKVYDNGEEKPILSVPLHAEWINNLSDEPAKCEHLVRVEWIKTVPEDQAFWEKGMRANQNSAFKLRSKFTLTKLTNFFSLEE
jgi:hypothetical protein